MDVPPVEGPNGPDPLRPQSDTRPLAAPGKSLGIGGTDSVTWSDEALLGTIDDRCRQIASCGETIRTTGVAIVKQSGKMVPIAPAKDIGGDGAVVAGL